MGCGVAGQIGRGRAARLIALALVAGVAAAALGSGGCHGAPPSGGAATAAGARGQEGGALPAFELTALDGSRLTRDSLRGRVVIVDFWDTWCGPCLRALPHLKAIGAEHPEVVVIGIAIGQEGEAKVRQVVATLGLPFPICLLPAQGNLVPAFGDIDALPTTFLIAPDGVIRRRWVGAQSPSTYENALKGLLAS
jgi:thiol-disulfide isomerase/thioredoxin